MADENTNDIPQEPEAAELDKLQQELGEARDKHIRLFAEFENMRKRHERERQQLIKYAHEEVIIEFLGFFEDFERTIEAAKASPNDGTAIVKGVEMVMKRMQELLKKYDVKTIDPLGQKFDHNLHEALMVVESDKEEDGTIVGVFQKGYMLGDRVVKTAKVKVARSAKGEEKEKQET